MQANNVIAFPSKKVSIPTVGPQSDAEVALNVSQVKFNHINETLSVIVPMIFSNIELAGFDFLPDDENDDDPNLKDGALLVETLRSILCKYYGISHPLQCVADELFVKEDDGSFTLAETLVIDFEKGND
jgi:hypothetical protein